MQNTAIDTVLIKGISIPFALITAIVGGFVGSGITLISGIIHNIFETRRHNQRLAHDENLKRQEREMSLRRDVYLKAADDLARKIQYLLRFGDSTLSMKGHAAMMDGVGASDTKIHMIASEKTLLAVIAANNLFGAATIQLQKQRVSLLILQNQSEALVGRIQSENRNLSELLERARAGTLPPHDPVRLNQILDQSHQRLALLQTERETLQVTILEQQRQLLLESQKRFIQYGNLLIDVNVGIRQEIDLPLADEAAYRGLMTNTLRDAETALGQFTMDTFPSINAPTPPEA